MTGSDNRGNWPRVDPLVSVETPEQIEFTYEVAGVGSRMLAYLFDLAIRVLGTGFVALMLFIFTGRVSPNLATGLLLIFLFAVEWGYHTLFEWLWSGTTPGKRLLGLKVIRTDGVALDFFRSLMRNLLRAADVFPLAYSTGVLVMFLSPKWRRLGDLAAGTMVVRQERGQLRDLPPLPENTVSVPHRLVAELKLKERDVALIDEFFRRRQLFSAERAQELARILVAAVESKLPGAAADPVSTLAGLLVAAHQRRTSWYGSVPPPALVTEKRRPAK